MDYTQGQKEQFKTEFVVKRRRFLVFAVLIIALILSNEALLYKDIDILYELPESSWIPIYFAILGSLVILAMLNWRCPACKRFLKRNFNITTCDKCGIALK